MKMVELVCQNCGANLDVNDNMAFCSYCGAKLVLDDGNRTITHNYNYTYTNIDETSIHENEQKSNLRLQELKYKAQKEKRDVWIGLIGFMVLLLIPLFIFVGLGISDYASEEKKAKAEAEGMISAGFHGDYEDEDYEAVVKQFEEMGFENIVIIDLDDSGLKLWENGKVESISIDGDSSFDSDDYFYPDDKVIIKYH